MEADPIKIFISYRRNDSPGHAGRLSDAFRNKYGREQIFKDVTNIRGGVHFPSIINKAIRDASVMVVTIGPGWTGKRLFRKARVFNEKDWIRQEIEAALAAEKHILPVLVNGGTMPKKSELPESLNFFADLNAIVVRDSKWEGDIKDVYNEIEQLVKLPLFTIESKSGEKKGSKKKKYPILVPLGLSFLSVILIAYFIFRLTVESKHQFATGDWRSKIAMVSSENEIESRSTGFFVSKNGHILTLFGNNEKYSVFNIFTADRKTYEAYEVSRMDLNGLTLLLLKSPLKNTPFLQLTSRIPYKNLPIEVLGVEGDTTKWKRYTARVLEGDNKSVSYDRPEDGWIGMMGSPIVDVSDEVAFGVHMGSSSDSINNSVNKKIGRGFCFSQGQIDSLLIKIKK